MLLAKRTVKNQVTLPKQVADRFPGVEYFAVSTEGDRIVLEPLVPDRAARVREKLAELGVLEEDVDRAVAWSRKRKR